jgi:beta-lactamase class D
MQAAAWSRVYDVAEFLFGVDEAVTKTLDEVLAEVDVSKKLDKSFKQQEAIKKYIAGSRVSFSSNQADMLIAGFGKLDYDFEYDLPYEFLVGWVLTEKQKETFAGMY